MLIFIYFFFLCCFSGQKSGKNRQSDHPSVRSVLVSTNVHSFVFLLYSLSVSLQSSFFLNWFCPLFCWRIFVALFACSSLADFHIRSESTNLRGTLPPFLISLVDFISNFCPNDFKNDDTRIVGTLVRKSFYCTSHHFVLFSHSTLGKTIVVPSLFIYLPTPATTAAAMAGVAFRI